MSDPAEGFMLVVDGRNGDVYSILSVASARARELSAQGHTVTVFALREVMTLQPKK